MVFVENVFPGLARFVDEGCTVAAATLIHVDGSSPRPVGAMIGVASDGRAVGMITGGCAEKAIITEALECLRTRDCKIVRYGAGSPYVDVVLPCGAGIDLFIDGKNTAAIVHDTAALHARRQAAFMCIDRASMTSKIVDAAPEDPSAHRFIMKYDPDYRIFVFGEGANLLSFCTLAHQAGYDVTAYSPDADALAQLAAKAITGQCVHRSADFSALEIDRFSAVVTLFHEHEWEAPILHAALNAPTDYIGALGSRQTHQQRLEMLAAMPETRRAPSEIHGPVGLDIGAANPNEIAVSILAEIVRHRRRRP